MSISKGPSSPVVASLKGRIGLTSTCILTVMIVLSPIRVAASGLPGDIKGDLRCLQSPPGRVRIEAGALWTRTKGGPVLLTGGVDIRGEGLSGHADWLEYFPEQDKIVMAGSVRLVEGDSILFGQRVELDRRLSRALVRGAVILLKRGGRQDLSASASASELMSAGINAFTLQGERLVRSGDHYVVNGARFTACDCGSQAPSWEIRASHADIVPGERAWLIWPVLYLKGLPVFAMPAAYLPLSRRRTGLLFPQLNYSGRDGFVVGESLFVTMGRSADTTLSVDWFEERGFRERVEFRARPDSESMLESRLMYMYDEKIANEESTERLRNRYSIELDARTSLGAGTFFSTEVRLYSDSNINRDFVSEMAGRAADYAPSKLLVERPGTDVRLSLDAAYRQDLRPAAADLFASQDGDPEGQKTHDTIQRLGAFSANLAPQGPEGWPLYFSADFEGANLSSITAAARDWGPDGTPDAKEPRYADPLSADYGADNGAGGDGVLGPGELRRAFRFLFEPRISLPLRLGSIALLSARLSHRQMVYLPHGPTTGFANPVPSTRGLTFAELALGTELSRSYSSGDLRIGHVLSPWVRLAGVWRGLESSAPYAYLDSKDRLMADAQQLLFGLDNAIYRQQAKRGFVRSLWFSLMQGVDLGRGKVSQLAAELSFTLKPFSGNAQLSYDWNENKLAEADAGLSYVDHRGDRAMVSYVYLPSMRDSAGRPLPLGERTQREEGLLFGMPGEYYRAMGESVQLIELTASAELAFGFAVSLGGSLDLQETALAWYGGGIRYESDCHCWGFSVTARMLRGQDFPDIFFLLDLAYLGAAGVGNNTRF
jgi:LPS-assembly protein